MLALSEVTTSRDDDTKVTFWQIAEEQNHVRMFEREYACNLRTANQHNTTD